MLPTIEFAIAQGDIFSFDADIVALKYAQAFYGADSRLAYSLQGKGISIEDLQPDIGAFQYVETFGYTRAKHALFVGVQPLTQFGYPEIETSLVKCLRE